MKKVLYIGWIGYRNLGDELMYDLFKEQFSSHIKNGELDFVNCEKRFMDNISIDDYHLVVLGGGSIMNGPQNILSPFIIDFLYNAVQAGVKVMVWGTGIDWLDKDTVRLLETGDDIPEVASAPILDEKSEAVFAGSVWAGVRGPLTYGMFKRLQLEENVQISGDPAFLLESSPPQESEKGYQKTIGVNWGTSFNNVYGKNEVFVEDQLAQAILHLIDKGYRIHLFIVWQTDIAATKSLYDKINRPDDVVMDTTMYDHQSLMDVIKKFHLTINFKLHANYLSLASNVPFIALGYRFKIYDFVQSINLRELLIEMDSGPIKEKILELEKNINQDYGAFVKRMGAYRNMYRARLIAPFVENLFLDE